ncbi:MAG: T9SS type A sorting domain-containing protein, partial [Chitinophagaceae bacterium]|nr:T9SS type A sorting domain-containing protein [Chitinophagaceae bacterium]
SIEYTFTSDLKIYPNPVNSILNVQATQRITKIEIFDVFGKKLKTIIDDSTLIHLKMDSYAKGIYFLKIYSEEMSFIVEKVIKK